MPTISVKKRLLDKHLGEELTQAEVDELCFRYGLELDDVVREKNEATGLEDELYKIEIPANRYDLLCVEGLARSLLIFQNKMKTPSYKLAKVKKPVRIIVEKETAEVRKFVVGAILRDIQMDADVYASFIDLQDKLHQNIGRKRTLASIGTHDLDTIKGPFRYAAQAPADIKFKPLNQSKEFTGVELMEFYKDSHLREYLPIIREKPLYPVIYDSTGLVCSLPPIVNGDHSKIGLHTKNIFIDATGTDLKKLEIVLDTLVTLFSQYCRTPFVIEPVEIVDPNGKVTKYPKLEYWDRVVDVQSLAAKVGIADVDVPRAMELLTKMSLACSPVGRESQIKVLIPPTRHDILHECDLAEDLALSYGYNAIPPCLPQSNTVAQPFPLNKLTDQLRLQMAMSGWTEILNFALCSSEDVGTKMASSGRGADVEEARRKELASVVRIANPKTLDFQVVRNSLLPGILKTIANNKDMALPLRLFECQDVVFIDASQDTKCRNERHLAAVFYSKSGSFEVIHGLLDRLMQMLNVPFDGNKGYSIGEAEDASYFPGRCAEVCYRGKRIGTFGVLHPEVCAHFALVNPCAALEMNIEPFLSTPTT